MLSLIIACLWFANCEPPPDTYSPEPLRMELELELEEVIEAVSLAQVDEPAPVFNPKRGNWPDSVEQWRALIAGQFPPEQVENALCIVRYESNGDAGVKNKNSNARGLFQIMTSTWADTFGWTYEDFYTPEKNVYAAAWIWERSGWKPWSARHKCGL